MTRILFATLFAGFCIRLAVLPNCAAQTTHIWDMQQLSNAPDVKWLDSTSPIRSLTYASEEFQGKPTSVFAFYATPGSLRGDTSTDKDLPAVVLVHGGGGTAFPEWVKLWAERGYAAIAMDLSGRRPAAPKFNSGKLASGLRTERVRLDDGGPEHGHPQKFDSIGGNTDDDWPYHAVASVIRAHSLIRSFPEVDANRTALTGISWGGYTTCITASVDSRFKAAVPVYGCGFLYDGESVQRPAIDALPAKRRTEWIRRYDPSSHLSKCTVPILFVNGTNDKHYPLKSYSRSFGLVPGPKQIRLEVRMKHGHTPGWEPQEIGIFIDHHLLGGPGLPKLEVPKTAFGGNTVRYNAPVALKSVSLHFTTDTGPLLQRQWQTAAGTFNPEAIHLPAAPDGTTIWFVSATDDRGAMASTDVVFVE